MEKLGDVIAQMVRTTRVSEEPVKKCPHCGRELYKVQLEFMSSTGEWKPLGPPFVESCDCEGARKEREEKERQEQERRAREWRQHEIERLLRRAGIGERFRRRTFETWDQRYNKAAYEVALQWAKAWGEDQEERKGLYIYGPYGTGKTHLAAAITNYLIQHYQVPVLFGTMPVLLRPLKDAIATSNTYELERAREDLYKVPLLVIDDLGKERATDFVSEELYNLINYRYEHMLPVIITSNYTLDEIAQKYNAFSKDYGDMKDIGSALASRLLEMCYMIPLKGPDYRKIKR